MNQTAQPIKSDPMDLTEIMRRKWAARIVTTLGHRTLRFGSLRAELADISAKTLTDALKALGDCRVVNRKQFPTIPPRVEYSLTSTGLALASLLVSLDQLNGSNRK